MISLLNLDNQFNETKNSLTVTYPRTVNIIFGNYPYPEIIHNFIMSIKSNIDPNMSGYTNVKGGMTAWDHFIDNSDFNKFLIFLINKHQTTHGHIFKHFMQKRKIKNAWGNEIKKGDSLDRHKHSCMHGILYLTKGCDLILPDLSIKITPKPGDYYIFPEEIFHGFDRYEGDDNRYSLVFNIIETNVFEYNKRVEEKILNERKNS